MILGGALSSPLGSLSAKQALELAKVYLENARNADDSNIAMVLCHDTKVSLSQAKKVIKRAKNPALIEGIASTYDDLGKQQETRGHDKEAQSSYKKAEKLRGTPRHGLNVASSKDTKVQPNGLIDFVGELQVPDTERNDPSGQENQEQQNQGHVVVVKVAPHIFAENVRPPVIDEELPEPDGRLVSTSQLARCLGLLQISQLKDNTLEPMDQKWLQNIGDDMGEKERLDTLATEVVRAFRNDEFKDSKAVAEVVCLASVINKDTFSRLLREFYSEIKQSSLLNLYHLKGLAQLIQVATPGHLNADDLVKILGLLSKRLQDTHSQAVSYRYQLTLAVSCVLDAMADTNVKGLDRERLHEPLLSYLGGLKGSDDPYLVYQAAYASQALLCVPDNETTWQAAMRRTSKLAQGITGIVSAVKSIDLNKLIQGLENIHEGLGDVSKVADVIKTAYDGASSLVKGGQGFKQCLKDGLNFDHKRSWYAALRGADTLIRDGELASFRRLVCEAPCRLDLAFQWGVCERLGEIAASSTWDTETRQSAIEFLGEIYRDDEVWGQEVDVKQWIIDILMRLSSSAGDSQSHKTFVEKLLEELKSNGDDTKRESYRTYRENEPMAYSFNVTPPVFPTPSLIDRAQKRPDVETNIRLLRRQRTKERGNAIYVPPQAKLSLQASDDARFPLMEKMKEFLDSEQKFFLLLGDSGAGKSTFNHKLEVNLWESYKAKTGRIPLHINLPEIDRPERDMIAKQLRKIDFSEAQICELKHYRKFILICDGYDESQQIHNLYKSNKLNEPGGWEAQMVISCRTEYLESDYFSRFHPKDRNQLLGIPLLQAVITPFSPDQMNDYIQQYVAIHQPVWDAEGYKKSLELVPSLKELVKNPYLMELSLEVLPRIMGPEQHLSARITKVELYDHFMEQWLERNKERIGEQDLSPKARAIFENLNDDGFVRNAMEYLKRLAVTIYKEQDGYPIVEYSGLVDDKSWKSEFFNKSDKRMLRDACPLIRNGNQYRFIHRSILEYGLAYAVFDPKDTRNKSTSEPFLGRRGSTSSSLSFEVEGTTRKSPIITMDPDFDSPLVWRNFVDDHSLMQFLEDRVQQEPVFKDQLLSYIEHSKMDKKWRLAAANAITILVRAGIPFIGTNFQGIQIPGADLSFGMFDSVQLQDADLRKVKLRGVWMRQTDLSRAQMTGVQFGELPVPTQDNDKHSIAYSPDGQSFATSVGNDISVFSTSNWETVQTLSGHSDKATFVVYSPNGHHIASCSKDGRIWLWNAVTGQCSHVIIGHTNSVHHVAYSSQGDKLASSGRDGAVRLWNTTTGECYRTLSGHTGWVTCVGYSPNNDQIACGSKEGIVRLWNTETGNCSHILIGHNDIIQNVAFSPREGQLASASSDRTIRLWDIQSGVCNHILTGNSGPVLCVVYSPSGDQVASGGCRGEIRLWDVEAGSIRHTFTSNSGRVCGIAYSPMVAQIATSGENGTVRVWDISVGAFRYVSDGHNQMVYEVHYLPDRDCIASCGTDGVIWLWDAETGSRQGTLEGGPLNVDYSISYSPQRGQIISGSSENSMRLWDIGSGKPRHTYATLNGPFFSVAFSPQGNQIASASFDGAVGVWDPETRDCIGRLNGHTGEAYSVEYSPDGKLIASCSDQTIRLWNVESWTCQQALEGHGGRGKCAIFSPLGNQLASAGGETEPGGDCAIRLWDIVTGSCQSILAGHELRVYCLAYTPTGETLASGSRDKTVRLWDVASGQCRGVIDNLSGPIRGVCWRVTSDDTRLVTGSEDGTVLMWKVIRGQGEGADQYRAELHWAKTNGALVAEGTSIQDTSGLALSNQRLLKQHGAKGEPKRTSQYLSSNSRPKNSNRVFVNSLVTRPEQLE